MSPEELRELLALAEAGRGELQNIDVGIHTEAVGIAWACLDRIVEIAWAGVLDDTKVRA